jgi:phosphatidyl-myo-inositol dimannoside synthase
MSKRKILLFTTDFPPSVGGGIGTHSHFMVESLIKLGWEFVVLCEYYIPSTEEEINNYSKEKGFKIYKLPTSHSSITLIKKLFFCYKIAFKYKPDIIIGTGRHTTWFAAIISFFTRTKLVTIGHGTEFTQKTSKNDFRWNRLAYGRSNLLIAISQATKDIVKESGISPKRLEIVHNGANEYLFQKIDPILVQNFKIAHGLTDKKVVFSSGALSERKGQKIIIKSLPMVLKVLPEVVYVAVGLPNKKQEFLELATELGVEKNVLFPGIVSNEELVLWLNACDLFTMTSINVNGDYEGFGIAVLEAALCGKTSLVSDNGGLVEAVLNNETGIVVKEGDINATAESLLDLLTNTEKRKNLAEKASLHTQQTGIYSVVSNKYDTLLTNLIKK